MREVADTVTILISTMGDPVQRIQLNQAQASGRAREIGRHLFKLLNSCSLVIQPQKRAVRGHGPILLIDLPPKTQAVFSLLEVLDKCLLKEFKWN